MADEPSFNQIIERIEALPEAGEGMTVGQIAEAVGTDSALVVAALEEIVERTERRGDDG